MVGMKHRRWTKGTQLSDAAVGRREVGINCGLEPWCLGM